MVYANAIIIAPAAMRATPIATGNVIFSPKNMAANTIAKIMLSLSMGTTCEALPDSNAKK
jgi:hypothetical protein